MRRKILVYDLEDRTMALRFDPQKRVVDAWCAQGHRYYCEHLVIDVVFRAAQRQVVLEEMKGWRVHWRILCSEALWRSALARIDRLHWRVEEVSSFRRFTR